MAKKNKQMSTFQSWQDHKDKDAIVLLNRQMSEAYQKEWTNLLMQHRDQELKAEYLSVVVFRLEQEWFALPTVYFKEVLHGRPIHRIPHRMGKVLLGIVNLGGEIQLCIALHELLEVDKSQHYLSIKDYQKNRFIAIEKENQLWVFPADEIDGIHIWDLSHLQNVPMNISKSRANYLKGIFKDQNKSIGLLDEELIFYSLNRGLT